jgi:cytosine/uracil/thiamine/allantoin permease
VARSRYSGSAHVSDPASTRGAPGRRTVELADHSRIDRSALFSRRGQREQMPGQVAALSTTMTIFSAMGGLIASATAVVYQRAIDFANAFPRLIRFRTGAVITGLIGIARQAWRHRYRGGFKWRAVAATVVGCALAWGGLVVPVLAPLCSYGWFVGFLAAALVHWSLMRLPRGGAHDSDHEIEAGQASASVAARALLRPSRSD